jgi:translation initiation factor IF-2
LPVRIYELAKEFGLPNKQVIEVCRKHGLDVKSHSSTIEEYEADMVRRELSGLAGDEDLEEEASPAQAVAPAPPQPPVPQMSPEEQLARARSLHVALPTRGPVKPRAEGVKLAPPRRPPAARPAAPAPAESPAPAQAPAPAAAVAEAPAVPTVQAPSAEVAVLAPPPGVEVAPPVPPAAPPEVAPAAPAAEAPAPTTEARAPQPPDGVRERLRPIRRPPGPKLAPKPKRPGPKLAPKPMRHPQAVTEKPTVPAPHPQATGAGVAKTKEPAARPGRQRLKPAPAIPGVGPEAVPAAEEAVGKGRRRRGGKKTAAEEEAEGLRRAQAFRRRERIRKREDLEEILPGGEGAGGATISPERPRLSRTGRPIATRPVRPAVRPVLPAEGARAAAIELPITVKGLSAALGIKASEIITGLMGKGVMATINDTLTEDQAAEIALEHEVELEIRHEKAPADIVREIEARVDPPEALVPRTPIVTFLGHVDHGKTSLMDFIRKTHVAEGEAGGITQHIGAYRVHIGDRWLTFLDTPGHAAFTALRARGAKVTDVAVLVVAGDDGVMPQTEEAINHAKAAGVPIVVAINKCDLPQANPQRVKQQLTQFGLVTEEWGGQTICVETSAVTGKGVDKLLESLLLEAEMRELRANPNRPAIGTVIEAQLSEGFGPMATLLVQNGTLHTGDIVLAGIAYGKVRALTDEHGKRMREAAPTVPVRVAGLSAVPEAGDRFYVLEDLSAAKQLAEDRQRQLRERELAEQRKPRSLEAVFEQMSAAEVKELPLIIKADVQGSVEALRENIEKIEHPEVRVRVIHAAVGGISESDVLLADASNAVIIGFNVVPDIEARLLAEDRNVDIRLYRIIYDVTDDMRKALEGMLKPKEEERHLGEANVVQIFKISRVGTVAGCMVTDGVINRNARIRVVRGGAIVHTGTIQSLKRVKDDAREVRAGQECGIHVAGFDDVKVGDRIEAFEVVSVLRTL